MKRLNHIVLFVVLLIFYILFRVLGFYFLGEIILMIFMIFLTILAHEIGHYLFGLIIGMKVRLFSVGPIIIYYYRGHYRLLANKIFTLGFGHCGMFKNLKKKDTQIPIYLCIYYMGGCISNIILFIVFQFIINKNEYYSKYYSVFALFNFIIALAVLIPFEGSDGYVGFHLLRRSKMIMDRIWIENMYLSDKPVREIDDIDLDRLNQYVCSGKDDHIVFAAICLISLTYLTNQKYCLAKKVLQDYRSRIIFQQKLNKDMNEVITFIIDLISFKEENKTHKMINKNNLRNKAMYYYNNSLDNRVRDYIYIALFK